MYSDKVKCYDCGKMVYDLSKHRPECKSRRSGGFTSKVRCYGCGQEVLDLKLHKRTECSKDKTSFKPKLGNDRSGRKHSKFDGDMEESGTDFYMLLDVSTSMAGNRLEDSKDSFREIEKSMKENDRIAVVTFDTHAFFKLHPHPVGKIRRQGEIEPLLDRIYAKGNTAIWDAIWLTVEQLNKKEQDTLIIVLTDGEDNSSTHSYRQVLDLLKLYPKVSLSIIHIGNHNKQYEELCTGRGEYRIIAEKEIIITVRTVFKKYYNRGAEEIPSESEVKISVDTSA